jgi:hypothetical protein
MSRHHPTLSPSAFPKLNLCVQYWPDPVVGKAADRGSNLHAQIESHHAHGTTITDKGAAAAYARATRYISDIRGVEQTLQLIDADLYNKGIERVYVNSAPEFDALSLIENAFQKLEPCQ